MSLFPPSTFASSAPSGVAGNLMEYFTFSEEVATLTISLFVAGYCVGPLLWGPLSEIVRIQITAGFCMLV